MNIAIFGIGALGSLFAAHLAPRNPVTLLGHWPEQLAALQEAPLRLLRPDGSEEQIPVRAVSTVPELLLADPPHLPELILVLVKSRQTEAAARDCRLLWAAAKVAGIIPVEPALVLTLQNGLGNREILADAVGQENAALGVTVQGASIVEPGVVRHAGVGLTTLARGGLAAEDRRLDAVVKVFDAAGIETRVVENADALVWGKLAVNAAINPLTALLGVENGALTELPLRRRLEATAHEVARVADALGIALPFPPGKSAADRALEVCRDTAGNRSSMLQDLDRGRPTEIDVVCGAVVKAGRKMGIPTPHNALYWQRVRAASGLPPAGDSETDIDPALAAELDSLIHQFKQEEYGSHGQD